jgi:hypothetical protein
MASIEVRYDRERGCGWRQAGATYLVTSNTLLTTCGRLPLALTLCGACGHGIHQTRSWTWLTLPEALAEADPQACQRGLWPHACDQGTCVTCPLSPTRSMGRVGLLWCGESFYKTPQDWTREAREQGVSRRISTVPNDFVVGETWVLMAHPKAIMGTNDAGEIAYHPGIFHAFKPSAIEYVVKGNESEEELERKEKRGITLIRIVRVGEQQELATV